MNGISACLPLDLSPEGTRGLFVPAQELRI